jgi:DNA polymerase-3 subunit alpha
VDFAPVRPGEQPNAYAAIVLLVQNEAGWRNLLKLNSQLYLRGDGTLPHVTLEELAAHGEGLICLTGGPDGPVGRHLRNGNRGRAQALLEQLAAIYPDRLYVELQRHPVEGGAPEAERLTERGHVEMAYEMGLPLVATNDVYFPVRTCTQPMTRCSASRMAPMSTSPNRAAA